jgi:hypothetical protein
MNRPGKWRDAVEPSKNRLDAVAAIYAGLCARARREVSEQVRHVSVDVGVTEADGW